MRPKSCFLALACAAAFVSSAASALEPDELFAKVSPSIVAIHGFDTRVKPFTYGSGVVIAPETVITNCHVLAKTRTIIVKRRNATYKATLQYPDVERDLCQLNVPDLNAPAVTLGNSTSVHVGQRAYAIGNPIGLELTLSDGLISGFRKIEGSGVPLIQTSAPASPGSSGGGLFDRDGNLIGITTMIGRDAQNITIANPVEWVHEMPARATEQLARYRDRAAPDRPADSASAEKTLTAQELTELFRTYREVRISMPSGLDKLVFRSNGNLSAEFTNDVREGSHRVSSDRLCLEFPSRRIRMVLTLTPLLPHVHDCFSVALISERKYRFISSDNKFVMEGEF